MNAFHGNNYMSCIPWLSPVFTCRRQILSVLLYSFIVLKICDFNPTERKIHFREIDLYFWGFGEKLNYF